MLSTRSLFISLISLISACEFTLGDHNANEEKTFDTITVDPLFKFSTTAEIDVRIDEFIIDLPDTANIGYVDIFSLSESNSIYNGRYRLIGNQLNIFTEVAVDSFGIIAHDLDGVNTYSSGTLPTPSQKSLPQTVNRSPNDSDGDGTVDRLDLYPNDPERSAYNCYPSCETFATILFEDQWPSKGDYDFNDLVMDYRITYVTNHNNRIVEMLITTKVKAVGGAMYHSLFFNLGLDNSRVESVSGNKIFKTDFLAFNSNGTEAGVDESIIPIFDVSKMVLPPPSGYNVVNVLDIQPYVSPIEFTTTVHFIEPILNSQLNRPPHDPFIAVEFNRGREIHLPGELPTSKIDTTLLGTKDDHPLSNKGHSYKTFSGHPWVLNISRAIKYPKENRDFSLSYLDFAKWAESNGNSYKSWYNSNSSNVNRDHLYRFNEDNL